MADTERVAAERLQQELASKKDVPLVEDFTLAPEEETPGFGDLATALGFRFVRAVEHWKGNIELTLSQIVVRTVEDGTRRGLINPMVSDGPAPRKDQ